MIEANKLWSIDWDKVTAEIAAGDYTTRDTIREAYNKVNEISKAQFAKNQEAARLKHIDDMKKLPAYAKVHYIGSAPGFIGQSGIKVKNGTNFMHVTIRKEGDAHAKIWRVPYRDIAAEPEAASTTAVKKGITKLLHP